MDNGVFDVSAWGVPGGSRKDGGLPFPVLKLKEGTVVLRVLDARSIWLRQHFDGGRQFVVCDGLDCSLSQSGSRQRCVAFWWLNVLDRSDGQVKVLRYTKTLGEPLHARIRSEGDPRAYDVSITRTGLKRDTHYTVDKGVNMEPVQVDASQIFNLEKLFASLLKEGRQQGFQDGRGTTNGSGENRYTIPDDESVV